MSQAHAVTIVDRRRIDRRKVPGFFSLFQLARHGRRHAAGRRADDHRLPYVDRYEPHLFFFVTAIMLLSAMDAAFTLKLLSAGAVELNTLMLVLIEDDVRKFVGFKLALTSLAMLLLVIHHRLPLGAGLKVRHLHYLIFTGYCTLIGYEVMLLRVALA